MKNQKAKEQVHHGDLSGHGNKGFRNLDLPNVDVCRAVPGGGTRRPIAGESDASEDARAFGQDPHAIVLGVLDKASDLDDEDPVGILYGKLCLGNQSVTAVWKEILGRHPCRVRSTPGRTTSSGMQCIYTCWG